MSGRAILTYHSLDDSGSVISVRPALFERQMEALAGARVKVVRLTELVSAPPPALALTFDDGFQNFADVAARALGHHGFPATVFLVTDYCGRRNDWPTQPEGIPRLPLMDWSCIRTLSGAGIEFGAHTATHPYLTAIREAEAREEILTSKQRIEDAIGQPVRAFAYPFGATSGPVRRMVKEYFTVGCSTRLGWVSPSSRPEALERLDVYYLSHLYLFRHLFQSSARWYLGLRSLAREWNAPQVPSS
ncbi:MAG: polysaccharide deacetylase family protein [Acidobacteria bacterium]|nr:polysaccharide deacetylase family protein [Acidobacteriota bacterium]